MLSVQSICVILAILYEQHVYSRYNTMCNTTDLDNMHGQTKQMKQIKSIRLIKVKIVPYNV